MPVHPINDLGAIGLVRDVSPRELPPNAWNELINMRVDGDAIEAAPYHTAAFGTPSVAPYTLMYTPAGTQHLWVYAGLASIYATDGTTHTNVSRAAGYSATAEENWTGCILGEVAILNNTFDPPQFWLPVSSMNTDFANLTNWPGGATCSAMRSFKQFLIAMDVTKNGVRYPHMVKWSHPADPRAVPASWDEGDPVRDAGEYTLSETPGFVVDCLPLRDINVVYKEDSTWGMQYIGGINIFRFVKLFDFGMRCRRAACITPKGHFVFTGDDLLVHDGQTFKSVLLGKEQATLNSLLDPAYIRRSFCATNWRHNEAWFCFVPAGATTTVPTLAYVWNYERDTLSLRQLPEVAAMTDVPLVVSTTADKWSGQTGTWDAAITPWGERTYYGSFRRLLSASPDNTKIYLHDDAASVGSAYVSRAKRVGLAFPVRSGLQPDITATKIVRELWPRITGPFGAQVRVYIRGKWAHDRGPDLIDKGSYGYAGASDSLLADGVWSGPHTFTIGVTEKINCLVSGKTFDVMYEGDMPGWRLDGHEFVYAVGGGY